MNQQNSLSQTLILLLYFFLAVLIFNLALYVIQAKIMNSAQEKSLFEKIKNGDEKAFEEFFHFYYGYLCTYACRFVVHENIAEEIVQDFFVKFWEKRNQIIIENSVKNYIFRSVKNGCLNYIQHNNIKSKFAQHFISDQQKMHFDSNSFLEIELAKKIEESIESLPEKRKEIFKLSREQGLKYREIAQKLNISLKTVETHMGLAIKSLREKLRDYNSFFLFFLNIHKNTD